MSVGMALHGIREWLREKNDWDHTRCGVQFGCIPPNRAGQTYVAIDDAGVDTGPENTNALTEIFNFEVAVWRKPGHLPKDFHGQMVMPEDIYLPEISTLEDLERRVIFWLHNRWDLRSFINQSFGLPDATKGDAYTGQLVYRGHGKVETAMPDENNAQLVFRGRRLRFRGLRRVQKISNCSA